MNNRGTVGIQHGQLQFGFTARTSRPDQRALTTCQAKPSDKILSFKDALQCHEKESRRELYDTIVQLASHIR